MKQKIVISVHMPCEKCRSKAMKIAVESDGVTKVEIGGGEENKDKLVVIGEQVDSVKLTRSLRKNLKWGASLLSVEEEEKKEEEDPIITPIDQWPMSSYIHYPTPYYEVVVVSDPNPSLCSVM